MAAATNYKSIAEKFEAITKGKQQRPGMIWLQNPDMDVPGSGNFTLVEAPEAQFNLPKSPFKTQGYVKYIHTKPVPAPVEAKTAKQ